MKREECRGCINLYDLLVVNYGPRCKLKKDRGEYQKIDFIKDCKEKSYGK